MFGWRQVTVVAVSAGVLILLLILFLRRCFRSKQHKEIPENLQSGISKLHHVNLHHQIDHIDNEPPIAKPNYSVFRRGSSLRPLFNWSDNPSLMTDAVENGWSRFAFTTYSSSPSVRSARSALWGPCGPTGERSREISVDMNWEICRESADFIQKIRFNSGLKRINSSALSVIKTALPLPGPSLGNASFPQEAYFEITVLSSFDDGDHERMLKGRKIEGEKTKLMKEVDNYNGKANSESLVHVTSSGNHGISKLEEMKLSSGKVEEREEVVNLAVGLTGGGSLHLKIPGTYPGSIGFNSGGSVYVDGIKLVTKAEKEEWGRTEKVIGCGYNPSQRKVFFTVDSELVHVIHCKSEEFGTPLYPTLAANIDIVVLVNFGQSVFKYAPANTQRTPNPCFIGTLQNSPSLGYEDSKELFSMGRIDSQWLNRSATRSSNNNGRDNRGSEFDDESESDFFEIVLDSCGRSPNTVL